MGAALPPDLLESLGTGSVMWLLLYGPPGCGKSLLAPRLAAAPAAAADARTGPR